MATFVSLRDTDKVVKGGFYQAWDNNYWYVDKNGNPIFYKCRDGIYPQCNVNKLMMSHRIDPQIEKDIGHKVTVKNIPLVVVKINPADFS